MAQSIWSLAALAGVAMGPVFITVIGQCMGKKDLGAAEYDCSSYGDHRYCCCDGL